MESISLQFPDFRVVADRYPADFLILRSEDRKGLQGLGRAIFQQQLPFVREVIATEAEVLIQLREPLSATQLEQLQQIEIHANSAPRTFHLPVHFSENADWESVTQHAGKTREALIGELCERTFSVAMLGFLPGFAYLTGLPGHLQVPRKSIPAKYVEAGSVAIGGKYLGVYALDSPGGWNIIGKTPLGLLAPAQLPPVPYLPGDHFRLQAIDASAFAAILSQSISLEDYHAGA